MVELQHRAVEPPALSNFCTNYPAATPEDFDGPVFRVFKPTIKAALNEDQGRLCVYCEQALGPADGQIEHITPKGGPNGQAALCFRYTNLAHSCIRNTTCGQKKKAGVLPIQPGPDCNTHWFISTTDASLHPHESLSRAGKHLVRQTCDMLGLNADSALVQERQNWLKQMLEIRKMAPDAVNDFLREAPFRYVFGTLL